MLAKVRRSYFFINSRVKTVENELFVMIFCTHTLKQKWVGDINIQNKELENE